MSGSRPDVSDVDPEADRCPWCDSWPILRWKGRHAAAKHPEEWAAFKEHFRRTTSSSARWEKP